MHAKNKFKTLACLIMIIIIISILIFTLVLIKPPFINHHCWTKIRDGFESILICVPNQFSNVFQLWAEICWEQNEFQTCSGQVYSNFYKYHKQNTIGMLFWTHWLKKMFQKYPLDCVRNMFRFKKMCSESILLFLNQTSIYLSTDWECTLAHLQNRRGFFV